MKNDNPKGAFITIPSIHFIETKTPHLVNLQRLWIRYSLYCQANVSLLITILSYELYSSKNPSRVGHMSSTV